MENTIRSIDAVEDLMILASLDSDTHKAINFEGGNIL